VEACLPDPRPAIPITQSSGKDSPKRINRSRSPVARSRLEATPVWQSPSAVNRTTDSLSIAPISGVPRSQRPRGGNWEVSTRQPNSDCQIRREVRVVP
jgi:hypothetical protein